MQGQRSPNRLIHESNLYLRQHAHNPVDWYPWGEEAIERARREDRPIFLSIGYSACHWCHVMERESFENPEIARRMNERFVNIKVDREERPDLDRIYMAAVQMMSGSGGWPMSVWLTPDLRPFFGGTYFPPEDRWGRPGFDRVLVSVAEAYRTRRRDVEEAAEAIAARIRTMSSVVAGDDPPEPQILRQAAKEIVAMADLDHGGFGRAPKFPSSIAHQFLLRRFRGDGDLEALEVVQLSLDSMAAGGIYDHLGGGFHRYATDERWLVPHFEKMLYDNALLALAYLDAYQVTENQAYARIVRETLDYVLREMTSVKGGFFATQDADSEGREGEHFVWSSREVEEILGPEESALFARAYGVQEAGGFEGRNILHRVIDDATLASISGAGVEEVRSRLATARSKLHEVRERRIKPGRDEKIAADWNGLMIHAFARASRVLGESRYKTAAHRAGAFMMKFMRGGEGRLFHVWQNGTARVPGFLDDHACVIVGLLELYQATGERFWLEQAARLESVMVQLFWDDAEGAFFDTAVGQEDLIARTRDASDGAVPSGNSMAAYGMILRARITGETEGLHRAERILRLYAERMRGLPLATTQMLLALDLFLAPPQEIVLIGDPKGEATRALRRVVDTAFLPYAVLIHGDSGEGLAAVEGKPLLNGRPAAYVCSGFSCRAPVADPAGLAGELGGRGA